MANIPKVAHKSTPEREFIGFPSARQAFKAFLRETCARDRRAVLLPAYVGFSPREGSGVLDPVRELDLPLGFYRVDERLQIDVGHLREQMERWSPGVVTLIHYFGYPDARYEECVRLAHERGALVLEDEAHALLTDMIGGLTGRLGDACIASLHKLLPLPSGGALIVNPRGADACRAIARKPDAELSLWRFDLGGFARIRRANAALLAELIRPLAGRVDPLWELPDGVVPQTFPVTIKGASRDVLYERMNAAGFGVVSLYHTMIDALDRATFPLSFELAKTMMNLPVHQEATEPALRALVATLDELTHSARRDGAGAA